MAERFGINFGASDIPLEWRRRFATTKRVKFTDATVQGNATDTRDGKVQGANAHLVGLCFDRETLAEMLVTATNGHRWLWVIERQIAGPLAFAIYAW